jgi:hypothetical protein
MKTQPILGLGAGIHVTLNVLSPMARGKDAAIVTSSIPIPIPAADFAVVDT